MAFWNVVAVGAAGILLNKLRKSIKEDAERHRLKHEEEERRKNTPCNFLNALSYDDFIDLVYGECKRIRRIKDVYVRGPLVEGYVESNSGLSKSKFTIDFNDYGHVSGKYWIKQENNETTLPKILARNISSAVEKFYINKGKSQCDNNTNHETTYKYEYAEKNGQETKTEHITVENRKIEEKIKAQKRKKRNKVILSAILIIVSLFVVFVAVASYKERIVVGYNETDLIGRDVDEVTLLLGDAGFTHVWPQPLDDLSMNEMKK